MKKRLLFAALSLAVLSASAERADSMQRTQISYGTLVIDDVSQTSIMTDGVVFTRGSLAMKAEKAIVKEDPQGYQFITLTAAPGQHVTFRQKRDGGPDLWVEGQADRIEYDDKTDVIKLFSKAKIKRLEGGKLSDEVSSEFISYDSRKEVMMARNDVSGQNKPGMGRGVMIIEPKNAPPAAPLPPAGKK